MKYSIKEISNIISATPFISTETSISILLTDSRSVSFPEESLFFAFKSKKNDGHNFILDLYKMRVRNFVVEQLRPEFLELQDANFLLVHDTLLAFQQLAIFHRQRFSIPIIGITGSNGKTMVKEFLYQLLHEDYVITRSPRSYNSQIGVPLSIWQLNEDSQLGIFEAGISKMDEMSRLQPIINPTIGILTNIREAHQENFASLQIKCMEKIALFSNCDVIIYDGDNALISNCLELNCLSIKTLAWSKKDQERPLYISKIIKKRCSTKIQFVYFSLESEIEIPFIDDASIENAIHCLAVSLYLGTSPETLQKRFCQLEQIEMRLEVVQGINNCTLINDSYNSDIQSLEIALSFQSRRVSEKGVKKTLILSDILQTGILPNFLYKRIADLINRYDIQRLIGIGKELKANREQFHMDATFFESTEELFRNFASLHFENEIILIKGSRKYGFEQIVERLVKKSHQTKLEVNLNAIIHNFNHYKEYLHKETKIVCMVKAFGYGAGSYELARTLQDQHCDYLAVAVADEGDELRKEGISIPIIVMNPEPDGFNELFRNQLEPEVYSFQLLEALISEASRRGITNYPIHIKIDTGMHRLGFSPNDTDSLIKRLKSQSSVLVRSVFSHLATADMPEEDDFTQMQLNTFIMVAEKIQKAFDHKILRHILNSAGIERYTQYQMDMVRLGIGLYGISASGIDKSLQPVSSLKTVILQIREVPSGDTIGYSRKTKLTRDSKIAVLPIGYADGINRHLGNGCGKVWINGSLCPIVGNICMDVCMVDVTDSNAKEGDTAILFGKEYPVEAIAEILQTIPYEILTSISPRVKRIYYME